MSAAVTRILVRLASARLDPAVSSSTFCELLEKLVDLVHDQAAATPAASIEPPKINTPAAGPAFKPRDPPPPPRLGKGWEEPERATPLPTRSTREELPAAKPGNASLRSLMYAEERSKLRDLARRAKGDKSDYPPGFLEAQAEYYAVTVEAVRNILEQPARGARRLSYDDKTRMRMRYDEALEGRQRVPKGFFDRLASDFNCKVATARDVCYRRDGT